MEQRLILLSIIEAIESGKGINTNDPLVIHAESYINHFSVHRNTAYQALKDACLDLFARQFSYQNLSEKGNVQNHRTRWVSEIIYVEKEAVVKLIFSPAVVPLITRLEKYFTSYELQQVSKLSTGYAVRLYELLICWRSTGRTPIIDIQEFRQKLGVLENQYTAMCNFKKRIIDPSIKQINQNTDITIIFTQHKIGRKITGFSFEFKQKPNTKQKKQAKKVISFTEKQLDIFSDKLSKLPSFQNHYLADTGVSTEEYAQQIKVKLSEPSTVKQWILYFLDRDYTHLQ